LIVGKSAVMVKVPALLPVPVGIVTAITPVEPAPGVAVIEVAEFTVNESAGVPPKDTPVAPVKLVPVIVTTADVAHPLVGEKEVIEGKVGAITVKI